MGNDLHADEEEEKPATLWGGASRGGAEPGVAPRKGGAGPARTHRLRGFDEHFAPPELELVTVHVDGLQQVEDTLFLISSPRRPGGFGQNGIPVRIIGERRIRCRLDCPPKASGAAGVLVIHSPLLTGLGMDLDNCQSVLGPGCPVWSCLLPPFLSDRFHVNAW